MDKDYYIQTESYVQYCDVCGEYFGPARHKGFNMCDKCKEAILAMRKQLEEKNDRPNNPNPDRPEL